MEKPKRGMRKAVPQIEDLPLEADQAGAGSSRSEAVVAAAVDKIVGGARPALCCGTGCSKCK